MVLSSCHGQCTQLSHDRKLLAQGITRQAAWVWAPSQRSHSRKAVIAQAGQSRAKVTKTHDGQLPVLFRLRRQYGPGQRVGVMGSIPELGNWNPNAVSVLLKWVRDEDNTMWHGCAHLPLGQEIEFKFVLVDDKSDNVVKAWINDVAGDKNLKLKVQEGYKLEVGDVHVEVQPESHRDLGESEGLLEDWDGTEQGQEKMINALNQKIAKQQEQLAKMVESLRRIKQRDGK